MQLVKATSISIGYHQALQRDLSFSINSGEVLFIRGENGTGKTTLVKSLLNEIKLLEGNLVLKDDLKIQYLPQLLSYDFPLSITLKEILDLYEIPKKLQDFLTPEVLSLRWQDASGGQRQKVLVLSRLQIGTELLILDEPFNHVDQRGVFELMDFFGKLVSGESIQAMAIISHIIPENSGSDMYKEINLQ